MVVFGTGSFKDDCFVVVHGRTLLLFERFHLNYMLRWDRCWWKNFQKCSDDGRNGDDDDDNENNDEKNGFFSFQLKAVLKCLLTGVKISNALLKLIFWWKCMKFGCMIIKEKNTSNDIFHFSVSVVELQFQPIDFLACHFFINYIQKLTQMLILTLFFRILGGLTEKRKTLCDFP